MSHTLANRCEYCDLLDDIVCPECGVSSYEIHGASIVRPFRVVTPEYVHQWHWDCPKRPDDLRERVL